MGKGGYSKEFLCFELYQEKWTLGLWSLNLTFLSSTSIFQHRALVHIFYHVFIGLLLIRTLAGPGVVRGWE